MMAGFLIPSSPKFLLASGRESCEALALESTGLRLESLSPLLASAQRRPLPRPSFVSQTKHGLQPKKISIGQILKIPQILKNNKRDQATPSLKGWFTQKTQDSFKRQLLKAYFGAKPYIP